MKILLTALRMFIVLTLITGAAYPALMIVIGKTLFAEQAEGSLIRRDGKIVGSALLAQKFEDPKYFRPRPSAGDYSTVPSAASNLSPASEKLREIVAERQRALEAGSGREMLFASGSGLDPDISPESALAQIPRIAKARGVNEAEVKTLVEDLTQERFLGVLGQERVNVLRLNLALDAGRAFPK